MFKFITLGVVTLASVLEIANAGLSDTWKETDFEEFYTEPLSTKRYPNNTFGYSMQFDQD